MKILLVLFVLVLAGCSGSEFPLAPVSGTVTLDGEPLEGVEVVFAPMESDEAVSVGPPSVGVTSSEGKFTLTTIRGLPGAVVAKHRVSVDSPEINEAEVAAKVDEVTSKNRSMPERKVMALERKVRQSMKSERSVPDSYNKKTKLRFEVKGQTDEANFELNGDGK